MKKLDEILLKINVSPKKRTYPMHIMRLIMEMESRWTPQKAMYPRTPSSMEMMEKATQSEHTGLGMKTTDTPIMTTAAMTTHCTVLGRTSRN